MTHKPGITYKGKTAIKDQPGQVVVNFIENNQEILIKMKYFHYDVMTKILTETPRKALKYARANGSVYDAKVQKHYIINIEEKLDIGDSQSSE